MELTQQDKQQHSQVSSDDVDFDKLFQLLKQKVPQSLSVYDMIRRRFFNGYSQKKLQEFFDLLEFWDTMELDQLLIEEFMSQQHYDFYINNEILAARVFKKIKDFVYNLKFKKLSKETLQELKGVQEFGAYLLRQELQMSMDCSCWNKNVVKSNKSYLSFTVGMNNQKNFNEEEQRNISQEVYQWIENTKVGFLLKLREFAVKVGFWNLKSSSSSFNPFMRNLSRLTRKEQKEHFIRSMTIPQLELLKEQAQGNNKGNTPEQIDQNLKILHQALPNYYFYKDSPRSGKAFKGIGQIHSRHKDYEFLESKQDYVQWMFATHYCSSANSQYPPLNYVESFLFNADPEVGLNLLRSTLMFLDFMGLSLNLKSLELTVSSKERLKNVILVKFHNHLRIMRLFACLSVTGFREIAVKLVNLLHRLTEKGQLLQAERTNFENSWLVYGDHADSQAKQYCFLEKEDFPHHHLAFSIVQQSFGQLILQAKVDQTKGKAVTLEKKVDMENQISKDSNEEI